MREDRIAGKNVAVIGAARSGLAASLLLSRHGANVFVSDNRNREALLSEIETLESNNIEYETGGHTDKVTQGMSFVVISPGVPPDAPVVRMIENAGVPQVSEIELGYWMCDGHIAGITGSNGKTTTTTLTGEIFKKGVGKAFVAGNIGNPFCDICDKVPEDGWVVLEVSSAQLEKCYEFRPEIATILNLTPDHLDRYGNFDTYAETKMRIGEQQTEDDAFVANFDDTYLVRLSTRLPGRKYYFSTSERVSPGAFIEDGELVFRTNGDVKTIMPVSDILLPGPHNLSNCAASATMALIAGIGSDVIRDVISNFKGVEHRLEKCGKIGGVSFINDSKATNVDSVWYALQSVPGKLVVIMGGRDKAGDFSRLNTLLEQHAIAVVLIGEASDKIAKTLGEIVPLHRATDMYEAVRVSYGLAVPDGTVMLSPACASFDMFTDYEHRGRVFKESVAKLQKEVG